MMAERGRGYVAGAAAESLHLNHKQQAEREKTGNDAGVL